MSSQALRVYTLGGFRIERGSDIIAPDQWPRRIGRQLFKCLLSRRTRRLPRDEAYELFWPTSDLDAASDHSAWNIFASGGCSKPGVEASDSFIVVDPDTIGIRRDADIWLDADAFERLLREARRPPTPRRCWRRPTACLSAITCQTTSTTTGRPMPRRPSQPVDRAPVRARRSREQRGDVNGAVLALQRLLERDRATSARPAS